jgi:hypothetical protein
VFSLVTQLIGNAGNVLLLGEKITLNLDIKKVSEGHLIYLVQSYLLYGNTQMQVCNCIDAIVLQE